MLLRLWRALSSRKTAIVLLAVVTGMMILSGLLPNPDFLEESEAQSLKEQYPFLIVLAERFNTQRVAGGYVFALSGFLLVISTTACSIDRFLEKKRARTSTLSGLPIHKFDLSMALEDWEPFSERLKTFLSSKRWSITEERSQGVAMLLAEKGQWGFAGSVFFHGILITVLIGAILHYLTAFYGTVKLTEGESRVLSHGLDKLEREPLIKVALPGLRVTLKDFKAEYWDDRQPVDYQADFAFENISTGRIWERAVKTNDPFTYEGMKYVMNFYGFSPRIAILKGGREIMDSFVSLGSGEGREDSFNIPFERLDVRVLLFPDFKESAEGFYSASLVLKNPVLLVNVGKDGRVLYKGFLPLGGAVQAEEYVIHFNEVRYWVVLSLVKETGLGFLFWSGMLGLMGLLVRFLDPDRKIFIRHEGDAVSVVSYSRHFEGILKEQTGELIRKLAAVEGEENVKA